jgi:hypothetical protein
MPRTLRSNNLDLIRWMNYGHENTAEKLAPVISNAAYLSKMATGDMEISDRKARAIEKELNLPTGWMDRDNEAVLVTPSEDIAVLAGLAKLSSAAKLNLARFLASCGEA